MTRRLCDECMNVYEFYCVAVVMGSRACVCSRGGGDGHLSVICNLAVVISIRIGFCICFAVSISTVLGNGSMIKISIDVGSLILSESRYRLINKHRY